jgi:hypothetical protein
MRVIGLLALLASLGLLIHGWSSRTADAATPGAGRTFLQIGQVAQLSGAPVACKAMLRDGLRTLDCRVAGQLAGTYGTLMNRGRLLVVRFRGVHLAKVVFQADQHGAFAVCR